MSLGKPDGTNNPDGHDGPQGEQTCPNCGETHRNLPHHLRNGCGGDEA